jgi:hypothetical protein
MMMVFAWEDAAEVWRLMMSNNVDEEGGSVAEEEPGFVFLRYVKSSLLLWVRVYSIVA